LILLTFGHQEAFDKPIPHHASIAPTTKDQYKAKQKWKVLLMTVLAVMR